MGGGDVLADILRRLQRVEEKLGIVEDESVPTKMEQSKESTQEREECSICFEGLKNDVYTLSCGHRFHVLCISKALSRAGDVVHMCGVCGVHLSHVEVRIVNKLGFNMRATKQRVSKRTLVNKTRQPSPKSRKTCFDSWFDDYVTTPQAQPALSTSEGATMSQFDRMLNVSNLYTHRPKTANDMVLHTKLLKD